MATSTLASVLCVLVLLPLGSNAAELVRREAEEVSLAPRGEAVHKHAHKHVHKHAHKHAHSAKHLHKEHPHTMVKTKADLWAQDMDKLALNFCNYDFVMGTEGEKECPSTHDIIESESLCMFAANRSGAITDHATFMVGDTPSQKVHPKGCFKYKCGGAVQSTNGVCYFYNPIGPDPDGTVVGEPVCQRRRFVNGTKDSEAADGGCPADYSVIDSEPICSSAGNCLGERENPEYRVGIKNASQSALHPAGCFYDNVLNEEMFNPASTLTKAATVQGTPICHVTNPVHWDGIHAAAPAAATAAAPAAATAAAPAAATGAAA